MSNKKRNILNDIKLIVYDFDGVFTDNKVILEENGTESVIVNRSDGLAVGLFKKMGMQQVILTTEKNKVAKARARKLGIEIKSGLEDKKAALMALCKTKGVLLRNVMYIGNDLNDLEAMKASGYPVAPDDAYAQVKKVAKIVTKTKGGDGVARELLDILLK